MLSATLMQAHPDIDVWLGDDDTIVGVESALMAMGKKPTDPLYLSGVNGQANALNAVRPAPLPRGHCLPERRVRVGDRPALCDYIEGKSVPQVQVLNPIPVTKQNIGHFLADDKNPKAAYARGIAGYLTLLGNIDYRTRMQRYITTSIH